MPDPQTDTTQQDEELKRQQALAAAQAKIGVPSVPAGLPAATAPQQQNVTPLPSRPTAGGLPAAGSTEDLEAKAAQGPSAATIRAAARKGITPSSMIPGAVGDLNSMTSSTSAGAAMPPAISPAQKELTSARQALEDTRNEKTPVQRLEDKAKGIQNPWARRFAEVGSGILGVGQKVLETALPGPLAGIPGTKPYQQQKAAGEMERISEAQKGVESEAKTTEDKAKADLEEQQAKQLGLLGGGKGLEEQQLRDLMTGENGHPRINPDTQQPYTFSEAAKAVYQTKELGSAKPEIKVSPSTGAVVSIQPDASGKQVETPVTDATGKPVVLDPKKEYDFKDIQGPDGKTHTYAVNKSDPKDRVDLGLGGKGGEASGKVYDAYVGRIDKAEQPVTALAGRVNLLANNLALKTQQADSVIAPELLSIVAGGAGSGLRMNDAEISRILGGANVWDQLKAKASKIKTEGGMFDDNQRGQMEQIMTYIQQKTNAKLALINQGRDAMLNNQGDETKVRSVYSSMQKGISKLESQGINTTGNFRVGDIVLMQGVPYEVTNVKNGVKGKPLIED